MSGFCSRLAICTFSYTANRRRIVNDLHPKFRDHWLVVAGDVGETFGDIEKVLQLLRRRYA